MVDQVNEISNIFESSTASFPMKTPQKSETTTNLSKLGTSEIPFLTKSILKMMFEVNDISNMGTCLTGQQL